MKYFSRDPSDTDNRIIHLKWKYVVLLFVTNKFQNICIFTCVQFSAEDIDKVEFFFIHAVFLHSIVPISASNK